MGIILILIAIVIGGVSIYQYKKEQSRATQNESEERSSVADVAESSMADEENNEETLEESPVDFKIEGLNEETYELLDTTEEELAKRLYDWTKNEQDYGTAVGVAFYPECQVNLVDQKYTLTMQTIIGEDSYPEESRVITLDYYKTQGNYDIHP